MKVLITGGFGYLGGRLGRYLFPLSGYEITLGSRKAVEIPDWLPGAKVVQTKWSSDQRLEEICQGVNAIVHMSGVNAEECYSDPVNALNFNGVCTSRLVQAAINAKVKRFIYLSTAHVYFSPLLGDISEKTCVKSIHPYATSHRAGEDAVRAASHKGDLDGIVIRLSNAFGAPVNMDVNCWNLLINDLCSQAVKGGSLVLKSNGLQRRDFIPITEVCNIIKHFLELSVDKLGNGVFNAGCGWSPTVKEVAQKVAERIYIITNNMPNIETSSSPANEQAGPLNYMIDKMIDTGFTLSSQRNIDKEIDQLVYFCLKNKSDSL